MSLKTCTRDAMECMKRRGAETAFPKFRFMEMCCERSEWEMKHHRPQQVLMSISTYKICQSRDHNHMKIWVKVSQNFKFQKILGS